MSVDAIADDVRRFIIGSIATVPHLEALLLLRSDDPPKAWTCAAVAARLYLQESVTATVLTDLTEQGLLTCADGDRRDYRYASRSAELARVVDRVAHAYATRLIDVTHLIHSRLERNAQRFADAFRWRKGEQE